MTLRPMGTKSKVGFSVVTGARAPRTSGAGAGELGGAERAELRLAGQRVAVDLGGRLDLHRHRLVDRDRPAEVVTVGGATGELHVALRARELAAQVAPGRGERQRDLLSAHRRVQRAVPGAVG